MIDRLKDWLGIAKPGGIDDIVVRAVKTAVYVFLAQPFVALIQRGEFDLNAGRAAIYAAVAAFLGALANTVLVALAKWSNS